MRLLYLEDPNGFYEGMRLNHVLPNPLEHDVIRYAALCSLCQVHRQLMLLHWEIIRLFDKINNLGIEAHDNYM